MQITDKTINALATLRSLAIEHGGELIDVVNELDNAGVFSPVDEEADYDTDPKGYARLGAVSRAVLAKVEADATCTPYHYGEYVTLNHLSGEARTVMVEENKGGGRIEVRFLNSDKKITVSSSSLSRT